MQLRWGEKQLWLGDADGIANTIPNGRSLNQRRGNKTHHDELHNPQIAALGL